MNHAFETDVFGTRQEARRYDAAIRVKAQFQSERVAFATNEARVCVG